MVIRNILALSFFPSYVPPTSGGEIGLFGLLNAMSRKANILLLSSSVVADAKEEVFRHNRNFQEIRVPKELRFHKIWDQYRDISKHADISNVIVAKLGETSTRMHEIFVEHYNWADLIWHDSPYTSTFDVFLGIDSKPRFYNSQNVERTFVTFQYPADVGGELHHYVDNLERKLVQKSQIVGACSSEDLTALLSDRTDSDYQSLVVHRAVELPVLKARASDQPLHAVFVGGNYAPNTEAAKFIVETLAPEFPDVRFDIVGNCLTEGAVGENVTLHGFVSDDEKKAILSRAAITLNPITKGSGVNLKLLEGAAYGHAIISTRFGLRGTVLGDEDDCIAAELAEFEAALRKLVRSPALRERLGQAARSRIESFHTWDATAASVAQAFELAEKLPRRGCDRDFVLALNDYDIPRSLGGGASRIQHLYQPVADYCSVVLLCFSSDQTLTTEEIYPNFHCIRVPKTAAHLDEDRRINGKFHISANDTTASNFVRDNKLFVLLFEHLAEKAARIVLEHPYMAPLLYGDKHPFVADSHNWEYNLKRQLLKDHPERDSILDIVSEVENFCVSHADLVVSVTEEDVHSLVHRSITLGSRNGPPTLILRNGCEEPPFRAEAAKPRDPARAGYAVFLGSAHPPNVDAARIVLDRLAPATPEVHYHLIGSVCDSLSSTLPNVHLLGVLSAEDKSNELYNAAFALNPMMTGSGSNVKISDYLAHGLQVVATPFGIRGFDETVKSDSVVVELDGFADACSSLMRNWQKSKGAHDASREKRIQYFYENLSLRTIGARFLEALCDLGQPKIRVAAFATRYNEPPLGGAEVHFLEFIKALSADGRFHVDVIAPDIARINDSHRFLSDFETATNSPVPTGMPRVSWVRFPVDEPGKDSQETAERNWAAQMSVDDVVHKKLKERRRHVGLGAGWNDPEFWPPRFVRWASHRASIDVPGIALAEVTGFTEQPVHVVASTDGGEVLFSGTLEDQFKLSLHCEAGDVIEFVASCRVRSPDDPRQKAFLIESLTLDGRDIDITRQERLFTDPDEAISVLADVASRVREEVGASLTRSRGPFSRAMKTWFDAAAENYDLVIAHNPILRHINEAIQAAHDHRIPSVLIPHIHFDEDYYHFPDVIQSMRDATEVLVSPPSVARFLNDNGFANVSYLPAGASFVPPAEADIAAFEALYNSDRPFFVLIGRKTGSKNYKAIIDAVDSANEKHPVNLVMIGNDEDGVEIKSKNVVYLGRQGQGVTNAALTRSLALVSMSQSESFGIVVVEAWMAGRPVIVNRECAAFRDLVADHVNGILATEASLAADMIELLQKPKLRQKLGRTGKADSDRFSWKSVSREFVEICHRRARTSEPPRV
jgi:glycosyltransferase involved in cell wall biosynthesis